MRALFSNLLVILTVLNISCTRTIFDKAEQNHFKATDNFKKTAVFALSEESSTYKPWENAVTKAFNSKGIKAVSGYKLINKPRSYI